MKEILAVDLFNGAATSSLNNAMGRHIIPSGGVYSIRNSRTNKRKIQKVRTMEDRKVNDPFYGKPRHKNTNGFG